MRMGQPINEEEKEILLKLGDILRYIKDHPKLREMFSKRQTIAFQEEEFQYFLQVQFYKKITPKRVGDENEKIL